MSVHCACTYLLSIIWLTDSCTICCMLLLLEVLPATKKWNASLQAGYGVAESESSTTPNTKPRGGKLARRARSFKEDFLEILSQMRSPGGGSAQRAGSPHSPKTRTSHKVASIDTVDGATEKNPLRDLDLHVKQVCHLGITISMARKIHCCLHCCYTLVHVVRHSLRSVI